MNQNLPRLLQPLFFVLLLALGRLALASGLPAVTDLAADAKTMRAKGVPMLLMFSAEHCGYCEHLKEDFLQPMTLNSDYNGKVMIRRIELGDSAEVRDFNGHMVDAADLAERYKVSVTPTVVFLDPQGNPLAPKMVGYSSPDFYGAYLDNHIDQAQERLRSMLKTPRVALK